MIQLETTPQNILTLKICLHEWFAVCFGVEATG